MIRKYSNSKIYKNLTIADILSIIALIVSIIIFLIDLIKFFIIGVFNNSVYFYVGLIVVPFLTLFFNNENGETNKHIEELKTENNFIEKPKYLGEKRFRNDYFHILIRILMSFLPCFYLLLEIILAVIFGFSEKVQADFFLTVRDLGAMAISHIFLFIADIFLIYNCVLIKREWKENPPEFISIEKQKIVERKLQRELIQKKKICLQLIEKSGIKFFIKYYKQIKKLPLRDVEISENYSLVEKEERLYAAKKIIDLNLTEFVLKEILAQYDLNQEEQKQIKAILNELQ